MFCGYLIQSVLFDLCSEHKVDSFDKIGSVFLIKALKTCVVLGGVPTLKLIKVHLQKLSLLIVVYN
jgi:hypothetical protein